MENLEEQKKYYDLNAEENARVAQTIYEKSTYGKKPSQRPLAIIVIGQPGAGKSGLMAYTQNQFPSAISLDIDEFRSFHPKYDELSANHPKIFEEVTGKMATNIMINYLTPRFIEDKYDLILHKTRGDDAVIYDTIIPLQKKGYDVVLRVLSVNHLESKMSALERSLAQLDTFGVCRWVRKDYHQKQYDSIPELVQQIQREKRADAIEVFVRGKVPVLPEIKYAKIIDNKILNNPHVLLKDGTPAIQDYNPANYSSPKDAVNKTREIAVPQILETIDSRLDKAKSKSVEEAQQYIDEVEEIANNYRATFGK